MVGSWVSDCVFGTAAFDAEPAVTEETVSVTLDTCARSVEGVVDDNKLRQQIITPNYSTKLRHADAATFFLQFVACSAYCV